VKRKKEAEKKASTWNPVGGSSNSITPPKRRGKSAHERTPVAKPTFTQSAQPMVDARRSLQASQIRTKPPPSRETMKTKAKDTTTAPKPVTKSEVFRSTSQSDVCTTWPVARSQQKFYPDYPRSDYYTFQPSYGNEKCADCHKPKPSPSLSFCKDCKDPPENLEPMFCRSCGNNKHPADFHNRTSDTCLSCLGIQICKGCHNEGDARWFPKSLWKNPGKDPFCFACLGNYVRCPTCSHWRHRGVELHDFCICNA